MASLLTSDGHIEVVSALTGKALDVPSASLSNGNQLQMYQANHTDAQKWTFNTSPVDHSGSFQLKTTVDESGVLDVSGGSKDSGAASQLWSSNLSLAQKWVLERQDDGSYTFKNANSGLYLTEIAKSGIEYRKEPSGYSYWILDASLNGDIVLKTNSPADVSIFPVDRALLVTVFLRTRVTEPRPNRGCSSHAI